MRKNAVTILLVFLMTAGALSAQNSSDAAQQRFEAEGYRVERTRSQGGMPVWDLRDTQGRTFAVHMIGTLTEGRAAALSSLLEIIYGMEGLQVERLRIVYDQDRATAIVIPRSFVIDGRPYEGYMPSGMQFVFDAAPAFDFRMLVENLAVRINGAFLTEDQFLARIVRAVDNPAAYIQSSDPQFLAQQIQELQRLTDLLEVESRRQVLEDEAIRNELAATRDEGTRLLNRQVARGEAAVSALNKRDEETAAAIALFRQEMADALTALERSGTDLGNEFVKMRDGAVIMASRSLFGSLKVIAPETLARVVELRSTNEALTVDEAVTAVNEGLPEGTEPVHKKHVQAVFAYFFNDYE